MAKPPPWAETCRNPYVGHDWICLGEEVIYVPDTGLPYVDFFNERCGECGLVVCRLIGPRDEGFSIYQSSSYPDDYRYTDLERPTRRQFMQWRMDNPDRLSKRRERLKLVS